MSNLTIIKIGGKVIDDPEALAQFLSDFSKIEGNKILVHGGGKIASELGRKMGIEPKMHEGRRITDDATLELVTMVYGGLVNKRIVSKLQALEVDALGLTGADANVLSAVKRPVKTVDYGYAGDVTVQDVNAARLTGFIEAGLVPVLCALTHDKAGKLLNTNADTIASILSAGLASQFEVNLTYCFEQPGVLSDFEKKTVIGHINGEVYEQLRADGTINEGMIPKMDNAFDALKAGVKEVRIGHFSEVLNLTLGSDSGTHISL